MKVGVLGVRGLPPAYGAFDQCLGELVKYSEIHDPELEYLVACDPAFRSQKFSYANVSRLFIKRTAGFGVLLFSLIAIISFRLRGARVLLSFGYGAAIFFPLAKLLGMRIICNTDGFEWRRHKWGYMARQFFKISESLCAYFADCLIFDASLIARYFSMNYNRRGVLLRYGCEQTVEQTDFDLNGLFGLSKSRYLFLVMRLEPENNIKMIVEAYRASSATIPLVIAGPSTPFFDRKVVPLIDNRFVVLGPIYDRAILKCLRDNAAAYIHGHSVGGTNPTLVEAVDSGLPVLAFDTRFNREVLGAFGNYFTNVESLTKLIDAGQWKYPAALTGEYLWSHICNGYLQVLRRT